MELLMYSGGILTLSAIAFFVRNKIVQVLAASLFLVLQWAFNTFLLFNQGVVLMNYFKADSLALIFITVLSITSIATVINSFVYFEKRKDKLLHRSVYLGSLIAFIGCMTGVFIAGNIFVMWILAEATTLCIAILIYHERHIESIEATWKYVFVSTIGLSFSFIGILLLDIAATGFGGNNLLFSKLANQAINIDNALLFQISFLMILIGFSVKMGVFPLHTVCIDAHSVAPSPVSAMISTSLMNVGFVALFRFYFIFAKTSLAGWIDHVLLIVGFLSILVAAVYMIKVKNYKRLIAYSSVEHMGLSAVGIAMGGVGCFAVILHLILHSFTKAGIFFQVAQFIRMFKTKRIYGAGEYFRMNPFGGIVVLMAFFLILGIPPSGMFFTELMIFKAMIAGGYLWLCCIILLLMCFIIWIFGKNILKILFQPVSDSVRAHAEKISFWESVPQFVLLVLALYIGIHPPEIIVTTIHDALIYLPK
ncbi:MAG: hypothetical protein M0R21_09100 [Lentimicrobiaceae bacterium]|nr:hypothetical protein [Lentimicrobiaceae bacterium]